MAQDKHRGADNAGKRTQSSEAERQERLAQLVLCRSKLSASQALLLREVFPEIVATHHDQVWSWLQRRGLSIHEAEDLLQETFLALHSNLLEHGFHEIEALLFSRRKREPSFYLDLFWPWLLSVLRGGIAYPWDLGATAPGPGSPWMLTLEPCSSPGTAPPITRISGIDVSTRETSYEPCLRCFVGSYFSLLFHIERAMAASLRAFVSFARFGFVPALMSRW